MVFARKISKHAEFISTLEPAERSSRTKYAEGRAVRTLSGEEVQWMREAIRGEENIGNHLAITNPAFRRGCGI